MESSINKIHLRGNVGSARILNIAQGSVVRFSLATNEVFKDRNGNVVQETQWHNIVAWSKLGEFCSKYFKKGQQVGVIGRLQTRTWDDDKGVKHYVTEVIAEEAYFADSKRDGEASTGSFENTFGTAFGGGAPMGGSDFDVSASDDLPF